MVEQFGMSPKIGPVTLSQDGSRFLEMKLPWERERETSEEFARIADEEVRRFESEAYGRAKSILSEHEASLRAVAEELKRAEVLEGAQLRAIVARVESGSHETAADTAAQGVDARERS
jgi:cell division protease FtsH